MKPLSLITLLFTTLAWAMTPADTVIRNQAVAQVAGERYLSNVVETVVRSLCVPSVTPNGTLALPGQRTVVSAGGFAYFSYLLKNSGNAPFAFTLTSQQQESVPWAIGAGDIKFFQDINGNALRDAGEPQIASIVLQAAQEARLVVEIKVPQGAGGEMNLSAIAVCPDGTADSDNYGRVTVGNGPALSLEKAIEPKTLTAGSETTFTLRLRNNGNQRAVGPIYITDALNTPELAGLSFVAGSAVAPKGSIEYSSDGIGWGAAASPVNHIRLVSAGLENGEETFLSFGMRAAPNAAAGLRRNVALAEGAGGPSQAQQQFSIVPHLEHHLGPVNNARALTGLEGSPDDLQRAMVVAGQGHCFGQTLENAGSAADSYTLSPGPLPAGLSVSLQDQAGLPLGTPLFLEAGQKLSFRLCVQTAAALSAGGPPLTITLTARSSAGPTNLTRDEITLLDPALLKLSKLQDISTRVEAGGSIVYTLRIENGLPIPLSNLVIEDVLDPNLELISASDAGSSFVRTLPENPPRQVTVVRWLLPWLAASTSKDLSLRVKVKETTPEGSTVRNAFSFRSAEMPNPRESNPVSIPVESVNILLQKAVSPSRVTYGDQLTYTLTVSNPFANNLMVRVVDTPAAGLAYVPGSASPQEPAQVGGTLVWTNLALPAKSSAVITYRMRVLPGAPQQLKNTAQAFSITSSGAAIASASSSATAQVLAGVFAPPHLLIGRVFLDADQDGLYTQGKDLPLPGARVVLTNGLQVVSDVEGRYSLRNLPGGIWEAYLDPASAPFKPLPHPEALGDGYRHRLRIEGLTVSDFPLEMPQGYLIEARRTVLEFGPLKVTKLLLALPEGMRVVLDLSSSQALPDFTLTDPLPEGGEKQFHFDSFEGQQTLTYDLPRGYLTDPQARWRYP
jgi:uncharacterized repeat protein (TIGR01451 family)